MPDKQHSPNNLGILTISACPFVCEGLHFILAKKSEIELRGDYLDRVKALPHFNHVHGRERPVNIVLTEGLTICYFVLNMP